ncbi:hypothetical protein AX16_008191 [Volvariella volvacea WC 439]|nr:hypothetical protein AX16_008191 [Volvariella volvacea WC 439]
MHRLSRHVLRPQQLTRLARASTSRTSNAALSAIIPRSYASSSSSNNGKNSNVNTPSTSSASSRGLHSSPKALSSSPAQQPKDRFDRLLAALKPGLKEDNLAAIVAAIIGSTKNQAKLELVEERLQECLEGLDQKRVYALVNHYVKNPPTERLVEVLGSEATETRDNTSEVGSKKVQGPTETLGEAISQNYFSPDMPIGSPTDELLSQLQTPAARQTIEQLEPQEQEKFRTLMSQVYRVSGAEDESVLSAIKDFMAEQGFTIRYTTRPKPVIQGKRVDWMKELRKLQKGEQAADSAEVEEVEEASTSTLNMDPIAFARRAVEDESLVAKREAPAAKADPFPDLMTPDPLMDSRDVMEFPATKSNPYHNKVTVRNHSSIFHEAMAENGFDFSSEDWKPTTTDETEEQLTSTENLPLSPVELRRLYRFPIYTRRITQQTGKGKIHRQYVLMIVGNGDGLVGLGQGKDADHARAESKAFAEAVRNMDWVERFEKRTIWTELETKLGATRLIMRPRPVGFGLRCNPGLHQVLKAAGIKDISAKVWGSRNKINVIKAAMRMLQAGHAPLAMGDGVGGRGKKLNKGSGLRSQWDVERERGRKLVSLRK